MNNSWYEVVPPEQRLGQGDLLFDCPLLVWKDDSPAVPRGDPAEISSFVEWRLRNVIVLSQACDLEHGKVKDVVLSPHFALSDYRLLWANWMQARNQIASEKAWKRMCEDVSDGYVWNLTFLDQFAGPDASTGVRVVDFHQVFTAPRRLLEAQIASAAKLRLRLRSPYVEHLSQAFARYFMRVGLPLPITPEWK